MAIELTDTSGPQISKSQLMRLATSKNIRDLEELGGTNALITAFDSSATEGLTPAKVVNLRTVYGENRLPSKPRRTYWDHLWEALREPVLLMLDFAAVITIIFGAAVSKERADWIEGIAIAVAVIIVAGVSSVQNYSQDQQFAALSKTKEDRQVLVIREGQEIAISIYDVVVGDIFVIKAGEILPTDGIFLEGHGIRCNESAMTGESHEIPKGPNDPFLVGGAQVVAGAGRMLVTTVGTSTTYGQIVMAIEQEEPPATPLQSKLEKMATRIGWVGILAGLATFLLLLIAYLIIHRDNYDNAFRSILNFFILSLAVVICAVPEGLPLAVTLALAYSMKRMIKDHVLVHELMACETMGSVTTICSDKTGTLTENRMTVVGGVFFGEKLPSSLPIGFKNKSCLNELAVAIAGNTDANILLGRGDFGAESIELQGNRTECSLLIFLHKLGLSYSELRTMLGKPLFRENFSSDRKRMATVYYDELRAGASSITGTGTPTPTPTSIPGTTVPSVAGTIVTTATTGAGVGMRPFGQSSSTSSSFSSSSSSTANAPLLVLCKGAPDVLITRCSQIRLADNTVPLTAERRESLFSAVEAAASQGQRTLAIAMRRMDTSMLRFDDMQDGAAWERAFVDDLIEKDMILLAVTAITDPVRAEVHTAVGQCISAGIRVRMVTGDNAITARSIARQCGILSGGRVMEGPEFRELSQEERLRIVPTLDILARAIPHDKLLLVSTLKELGETVAVTGDGTNDAPALRAAHVGCSMGIAGTEVAKEASKVVILDDNFASIAVAVMWGRSIRENIRKFLVFQLTINIVAAALTFLMACVHPGTITDFPLTAMQLLWINLIMDSFAALALATEPPHAELMSQPPQDSQTPLISKTMYKYIFGHAAYQVALLMWLTLTPSGAAVFLIDESKSHSIEHYSCIFNTFVWLQLFNLLNARRLNDQWNLFRNINRSVIFLFIIVLVIVIQIFIVEFGGEVFQTAPLSGAQWMICICFGATAIIAGFFLRSTRLCGSMTTSHHLAPSESTDVQVEMPDAVSPADVNVQPPTPTRAAQTAPLVPHRMIRNAMGSNGGTTGGRTSAEGRVDTAVVGVTPIRHATVPLNMTL